MRLKSLNYTQFAGQPSEWRLDGLALDSINLIVGKNTTGKSKVVSLINNLAMLISAGTKLRFVEGQFDLLFEGNEGSIHYILEYSENKVSREIFTLNGENLLTRGQGGAGTIYAVKEGRPIEFQTPQDEIAAVNRRDSLQHPYLEPLYQWAKTVLFYHFGSTLGRENLPLILPNSSLSDPDLDIRNEHALIPIYTLGYEKFGDTFDLAIRQDMAEVGYELEDVRSEPLPSLFTDIAKQMGRFPIGMLVKEKDLPFHTEHFDMSTGMFRALSLIVQVNYALMAKFPSTILIDDIGEGLDYTRSCAIIQVLIRKARESNVLLVMTSNDRYVMNAVPLEYWSVLQREVGHVRVFNYSNSKAIFDDFKFTGLNNFDFFAYDYLNASSDEEEVHAENGSVC